MNSRPSTRERPGPTGKVPPARSNMVIICVGIVVALIAGVAIALWNDRSSSTASAVANAPTDQTSQIAARPDSHRLSDPATAQATFVEFLDFECEACAAFYPYVEQLRADYGDRVEFVVRYFPLPSHFNAERAARAVEAAAQQGRFKDMYSRMYEFQSSWGEQQIPMDAVFRGYAVDLGLDMTAWDAAYQAPATVERVNADVADGRALGVQGTPTFFLDGERLQPGSFQELTDALDAALR